MHNGLTCATFPPKHEMKKNYPLKNFLYFPQKLISYVFSNPRIIADLFYSPSLRKSKKLSHAYLKNPNIPNEYSFLYLPTPLPPPKNAISENFLQLKLY